MTGVDGCDIACDARERYSGGRNCAEAVMGALERSGTGRRLPDHLGAGFTGGIGHAGCVCGALAGGVAVLGEHARTAGLEPVATRVLAEELSSELHERFTGEFGAACCRVIKRGQTPGSDEWMSGCARITEWTAATVEELTRARAAGRSPRAVQDTMALLHAVALGALASGAIAVLLSAHQAVRPVAATGFAGVTLAGAALSAALEAGGPRSRRAGRLLRATGAVAGALFVALAAFQPMLVTAHVALAPDAGPAVVAARIALALAALAVAALAAFRFKRYR